MSPVPDTRNWITFTLDGREVRAPDGEYLLEAAKRGDVEIPFFCYEPKLVDPVGACRMCLVEIEGIPKLQTSCSTPVKDGMVVYTETDRVKQAQQGVVEFLLINHPLDCPVCDKGGECPLQDISFGWGEGHSRMVDPKRVFPKPIALSPLVAIDRERCILCYRCVRFSQEASEDYQLTFLERGDHTFVGTFDGHPYVAPFSGNITELCPVGALTSTPYRFRARPWDIEQSGSICTLCPSQCNVSFTVRDERVERVLARENDQVDNGWLCDKGRYSFQTIESDERITQPLIRDGGSLRPATWERAMAVAVAGLSKAGAASAAIVGGSTTNEEGHVLQRIFREALGSGNIDSRRCGAADADSARLLAHPSLSASVADIDDAGVVLVLECDPLNEAPILDLRIRKSVRHFGARLVTASSGPTALDGGASERLQFAPGGAEALLRALQKALQEADRPQADDRVRDGMTGYAELAKFLGEHDLDDLARRAGLDAHDLRDTATLLSEAQDVVIVWGERLAHSETALQALGDLALMLGLDRTGSGLLELPAAANARGLREVGCVPDSATAGAVKAYYLLHADPLRELPGQQQWDRALGGAGFVVAHAMFRNQSVSQHADVVFPAESHAEKDGTVTHPDGRIQRVRPAIGHRDGVRMGWQVLVELANRLGLDLSALGTSAAIFDEITREIPFYAGITLDEIAGRGVRWVEREQASAAPGELRFSSAADPPDATPANGALALVTARGLWASWETDFAPALRFLRTEQELALSIADADRLGLGDGDRAEVGSNGHAVHATVRLRSGVRPGAAYLIDGTSENNANLLHADGAVVAVDVRKLEQARS